MGEYDIFNNDEIDRLFKKMSKTFCNMDEFFEGAQNPGAQPGPVYYGYTMTVGPDGKPVIKEYGNVRPRLDASEKREPLVDTIVDEKEKVVKLVAEMPGVEKSDVKIVVEGTIADIAAEHGEKKYHVKVPLARKVEKDSAKASYKNGILELVFKLAAPEKPKGKTVEVQ